MLSSKKDQSLDRKVFIFYLLIFIELVHSFFFLSDHKFSKIYKKINFNQSMESCFLLIRENVLDPIFINPTRKGTVKKTQKNKST